MHHRILLLLLLLLLHYLSSATAQPPPSDPNLAVPNDAIALLTFKSTADKDNTLHYTLTEHFDYCHWQGVKCQAGRVVRFFLPSSALRGGLPSDGSFSRLQQLRVLVLRNNSLSGDLPDFSDLVNLRSLILSRNAFSGSFPASVVSLYKLRVLDLSFNNFSGTVPPQLWRLDRLILLKLQSNAFDGAPPLLNQSTLENFDIAGNNFSGEIPNTSALSRFPPSAFAGNPNLCGEVIHKHCLSPSPFFDSSSAAAGNRPSSPNPSSTSILSPPSRHLSRRRKVLILVFTFGGMVLLSSFLCLLLTTRMRRRNHTSAAATSAAESDTNGKTVFSAAISAPPSPEVIRVRLDSCSNELKEKCGEIVGSVKSKTREKSGNLVFCMGEAKLYTLEQLMRASAEMLGRGTMGTTYKAKLDNQLIVTVKRLDAMKMSGVDGEMFEQHMEGVGRLRHPNLVPVRAFFQARDERLIIFDYQPNGSVFSLIHGSRSTRAKPLHWTSCLKIAEDVAQGLAYIHQASKLIHGNLKASNVLLGADFEACVTDYCLATLAGAASENDDPDSARYRGPEARQSGRRATHKSDVYAFGVLLLELVSGKPPSQHPFLAPPDMPDWVKAVRGVDDDFEDSQLGMLVEVSSLCSLTSPEQRPTMWQVLKMIQRIKASVGPDDAIDTSSGYA